MKLPHADRAIVAKEKITNYLLNAAHPQGGPKADFFLSFGFSLETWEILAKALALHALINEVVDSEVTEYGSRYSVDGPLFSPSGTTLNVRTAWYIDPGSDRPRFVTAHPLRRL